MSDERPLVSAIIPAFNAERTVARAIESALAQQFDGRLEVVVADDGSTDGTRAVLEKYRGRIVIVPRANGGAAAARNSAVRASHGKYLAFLDADDEWLPGRVAAALPILENDLACALVYSELVHIDESGNELEFEPLPERFRHAPSMEDVLTSLWPILPSMAVLRRSVFDGIGGFSEEFKVCGYEDSLLFIMAREHGYYRRLEDRLTRKGRTITRARLEAFIAAGRIFEIKIKERYGKKAAALMRANRAERAHHLVNIAALAVKEGDRLGARNAYVRAIRVKPSAKSLIRLAWFSMPPAMEKAVSRLMPAGMAEKLQFKAALHQ
jgi:glycosyltransferase involved in cell wall biosynthesis